MEIIITLGISFALSLLVGMERQLSKKPVGFAPYVLVTVMSTALTVMAQTSFASASSAIVSGIMTGIGFLGAGALIKSHEKVFGFTTASAVWAMAAFGIIVAVADPLVIAFAYAVVWATIGIDRIIEKRGLGRHTRTVTIEARGRASHEGIKSIISRYRESKEEGMEMNFDRDIVEYTFVVPGSAGDKMVEKLSKLKGIRKIHLD